MSAAAELQAALVAALRDGGGIDGVVSGVFDGAPARAPFPYLVIGEGMSLDWSTKTARGREHRVAVTAWDEAGRTARLLGLIGAVEDAVEGLDRELPEHRIVSIIFGRSRVVRPADGPWAGTVEYRVRTLEG